MKRLLLLFLVLALLVIVPFLIWGDWFEKSMSMENTVEWLRSTESWGWAVGIALLVLDLFLPVFGTVVMSALGFVYGWLLGGIFAAVGSIGAGLVAYGLCFRLGHRAAVWLAGEKGLAEAEHLFEGETGGWLVALSRWMPVLPEVVACMAGISRMPFLRFFGALCVGSVPMGFVFAWIGHSGESSPGLALGLSAGIPPVLWAISRGVFHALARRKKNQPETSTSPGSDPTK